MIRRIFFGAVIIIGLWVVAGLLGGVFAGLFDAFAPAAVVGSPLGPGNPMSFFWWTLIVFVGLVAVWRWSK